MCSQSKSDKGGSIISSSYSSEIGITSSAVSMHLTCILKEGNKTKKQKFREKTQEERRQEGKHNVDEIHNEWKETNSSLVERKG